MSRPEAFEIAVSDAVLSDLRERLTATRWPEQVTDSGWVYGCDTAYIRELCDYWRTDYDWRAAERRLNRWPQFCASVDGVRIHFWHLRGERRGFPLVLIHGWPGSTFEFAEMLDPLAESGFDVVVPSLPGFGFGAKPMDRGWGARRTAHAIHTLLTRVLGYERYGLQGGDWGAIVSANIAAFYPQAVAGLHLNMPFATAAAGRSDDPAERAFRAREFGYSHIQRTKPDSLTVAQSDSPAGLAAWVVEKFRTWSDCGGNVEASFSKDTLLTNLMFYWAPNATASAARFYFETNEERERLTERVAVPTAVAAFPAEPFSSARDRAEASFNICRWTVMPRGGHFAALEEPTMLTHDVVEFFSGVNS